MTNVGRAYAFVRCVALKATNGNTTRPVAEKFSLALQCTPIAFTWPLHADVPRSTNVTLVTDDASVENDDQREIARDYSKQ